MLRMILAIWYWLSTVPRPWSKDNSMNTRSLFKQLRKLQCQVTNDHPDLNCGGCGIFAYLVGEKLQALGLEVEVVTPLWSYEGLPAIEVRKNVTNINDCAEWDDNGLSRSHLAVRFKTKSGQVYTYDSDTFFRCSGYFGERLYKTDRRFGSGLTVEETKAICQQQRGWNRTFDREEIPQLQSTINHFFPQQGELQNV